MPHKHTRKTHDPSLFDLPPSQIAKPLPVTVNRRKNATATANTKPSQPRISKAQRKRGGDNDTPRAFKRLMAFASGKKPRPALDDGLPQRQKTTVASGAETAPELPTIRPGEKMAEFAARVDTALPLSGLANKSVKDGKDPLGLKVYKTRKEKKMHKLYDQWREEDRKIKERREEAIEETAELELDNETAGAGFGGSIADVDGPATGGGKKRKRKGAGTSKEDPWAEIKRMRGEQRPGLHDVALAPPELHKPAGNKLLVRGAVVDVGSIPKSAGSLRRREELQEIRTDVVAAYRKAREQRLHKQTG